MYTQFLKKHVVKLKLLLKKKKNTFHEMRFRKKRKIPSRDSRDTDTQARFRLISIVVT